MRAALQHLHAVFKSNFSGLDLTPPAAERTLADDTPIVVVLHGLTGGTDELASELPVRFTQGSSSAGRIT